MKASLQILTCLSDLTNLIKDCIDTRKYKKLHLLAKYYNTIITKIEEGQK